MTGPKISVVVAVYNRAAHIEACIDGFVRQTYPNKELIVIDGGSTDGTVDIVKKHNHEIAYWMSEPDKGIYDAWNKALDHATGDWICFLGSDDSFVSDDVLERMAPHLQSAYPAVRVVYGSIAVLDKHGNTVEYRGKPWPECRNGFLYTLTIPHPGAMHHKTLFEEHGKFDISLRVTADHDLLLRELRTRDALFVPGLVTVAFGHDGISNNPAAMAGILKEMQRMYKKHGIKHPITRRYDRVVFKVILCSWTYRIVGDKGFRIAADAVRRLRGRPAIWR